MINIILAEDNPADVYLVRLALATVQLPHELHVLADGGDASNVVRELGNPGHLPCPDILILDINLPKVDGPDILKEFRKRPRCETTPVIMVSSSDSPDDLARVADLGVAAYFRKPADLDEFLKLGGIIRDLAGTTTAIDSDTDDSRPAEF